MGQDHLYMAATYSVTIRRTALRGFVGGCTRRDTTKYYHIFLVC